MILSIFFNQFDPKPAVYGIAIMVLIFSIIVIINQIRKIIKHRHEKQMLEELIFDLVYALAGASSSYFLYKFGENNDFVPLLIYGAVLAALLDIRRKRENNKTHTPNNDQ